MSEHIHVEESFIEALLEQAAWTKAGVPLSEKKKKAIKASNGEDDDGEAALQAFDNTEKAKAADKETDDAEGSEGEADAKADASLDASKKTKKKSAKKESTETEGHTCPLCESTLDEELSDERIYEHVAQIQKALTTLEEADDEVENDQGPQFGKDDNGDMDEKKKKVLKKVKALKASAKGK